MPNCWAVYVTTMIGHEAPVSTTVGPKNTNRDPTPSLQFPQLQFSTLTTENVVTPLARQMAPEREVFPRR